MIGRHDRSTRRTAFTLIELLVVITIALLLLGILVPTLHKVRERAMAQGSQVIISVLDTACRYYQDDLKVFPPSSTTGVPANGGGQLLVKALTGYDFSVWDSGDDGNRGYGFRVKPPGSNTYGRSRVYGPYNDAESLTLVAPKGGSFANASAMLFADRFDQPLLYYRFDRQEVKYVTADNPSPPGPGDIDHYAKQPGGAYYETDFLIISPGPDGEYEAAQDDSRTDDITNFLKQ